MKLYKIVLRDPLRKNLSSKKESESNEVMSNNDCMQAKSFMFHILCFMLADDVRECYHCICIWKSHSCYDHHCCILIILQSFLSLWHIFCNGIFNHYSYYEIYVTSKVLLSLSHWFVWCTCLISAGASTRRGPTKAIAFSTTTSQSSPQQTISNSPQIPSARLPCGTRTTTRGGAGRKRNPCSFWGCISKGEKKSFCRERTQIRRTRGGALVCENRVNIEIDSFIIIWEGFSWRGGCYKGLVATTK